jgi:hypothetical protein
VSAYADSAVFLRLHDWVVCHGTIRRSLDLICFIDEMAMPGGSGDVGTVAQSDFVSSAMFRSRGKT